jgi:hypothetical protein
MKHSRMPVKAFSCDWRKCEYLAIRTRYSPCPSSGRSVTLAKARRRSPMLRIATMSAQEVVATTGILPAKVHIRKWPKSERSREKLLARGAHALSDAELLAVLPRCGTRGRNAFELAQEHIWRSGLRASFSRRSGRGKVRTDGWRRRCWHGLLRGVTSRARAGSQALAPTSESHLPGAPARCNGGNPCSWPHIM